MPHLNQSVVINQHRKYTKHIRRKHSLIAAALLVLFISSSRAGEQQHAYNAGAVITDTTISKDSLALLIADPKLGFKDLFASASLVNGISTEQLNPHAISFVEDYIEKNGKKMTEMKDWGKPYFDMMDNILSQHGLPKELKYLAVIESHLKSNARSWVGAVGPWQFMPATARTFGLKVNRSFDERTDYFKSTHAASRYLTDLFSIYGDWLLVIAAYNGGPGNVNQAIRKAGKKDFWALQNYLPAESRNHVKKFIATHYIMEGQGGITTATKAELKDLLLANKASLTADEITNSTTYTITGRFNSQIIIKYTGIDILLFSRYNPDFDNQVALNGKYELRLPTDKMNIFVLKRYEILNESVQMLLNQATSQR
jgi:membrane-bound lytic murein transglycosylase D